MHDPLEKHAPDRPIFAPDAFRLSPSQGELIAKAREFGRRVLAPRAQKYDREASFPIENFRDMHREGLLGICIPKEEGGVRRGLRDLLPRRCGAWPLLRGDCAFLEHACVLHAVVGRTC